MAESLAVCGCTLAAIGLWLQWQIAALEQLVPYLQLLTAGRVAIQDWESHDTSPATCEMIAQIDPSGSQLNSARLV